MKHTVEPGRQVLSWRPFVFIVVIFSLVAACHVPPAGQAGAPAYERDVLTREEILNSTAQQGDLLQAITSLRPQFLANPRVSTPGSASSSPIAVYIGLTRLSTGLEALRSISATKVAEVRYLEPMASQSQFGSSAAGGALIVKLYRPDDPDPPRDSLVRRD